MKMNIKLKHLLIISLMSSSALAYTDAELPDLAAKPTLDCEIGETDHELVSRFEESYGAALDANWGNFITQYSLFKRNFLNDLVVRLENARASVAQTERADVDAVLAEIKKIRAADVADEVVSGKQELKNSMICALVEMPDIAKEKFLARQGIDTAFGFTFFSISPAMFPKIGSGVTRLLGIDIEASIDAVMTIKSALVNHTKGRFGLDFLLTVGGGVKIARPPEQDRLDLRLLKDAFSLRSILNPKLYWRSGEAGQDGLQVGDLDGVYNTTSVEFRLRRFARLKVQAGTMIGSNDLDIPLVGNVPAPKLEGVHFVSMRGMENSGEGTDVSLNYKPYFGTYSFGSRAGQIGSLLMRWSGEATIDEFATDEQFVGE